jgi:hypothetical protein
VFGERGDVQREQHLTAHREHVTHGVRSRYRSIDIGIVDDRREEVKCLNDRLLVVQAVDGSIIAGLKTDDQVWVGESGQRAQNLRQGVRPEFGCSAGAVRQGREPDLVSRLHASPFAVVA